MTSSVQRTVLIVDGDSAVRQRWRQAVEQDGHRVLEADCRTDAFAMLRDIDLLVTSVMLDGSGALLAAEAFELAPDLPIVVVAGLADQVGVFERFAVLLEPVTTEELIETVRSLLGPERASGIDPERA